MKNKFKQYFNYNNNELRALWENSIFIFDTNVLLNFYRYSENTKNEFINTINELGDKLWLPYHIVQEFFDKRLDVIYTQIKIYKSFKDKITRLEGELSNKNRNPFLSPGLLNKYNQMFKDVLGELTEKEIYFDSLFTKDTILDQLSNLFKEKVGDKYSKDRLEEVYTEAKERYLRKIPPGFKDSNKPEPARYGDLILWFQIIDKAKVENKPVIFITDDRKGDWWLECAGKTISPHPKLLCEFTSKTKNNCHFYKPFQFLSFSNEYLCSDINEEIIKEVENTRQQYKPLYEEIHIELFTYAQSSKNSVVDFVELLRSAGYQTSYYELSESEAQVVITIPNIPDLERRFRDKYMSLLDKYDLKLMDYKKYEKSVNADQY